MESQGCLKRNVFSLSKKLKDEQIEYLKELINKSCSEVIILQNIKKMMINGKLELEGFTSKQRQYLHNLAEKYNMEHYSVGNYTNRVIVLKDKLHTYFSKDSLNIGNPFFSSASNLKIETKNLSQHVNSDEEDKDESDEESDEEYNEESDEESCEDSDDECDENKVNVNTFDNFTIGEKCIYLLSVFNILVSSYTLVKVSALY